MKFIHRHADYLKQFKSINEYEKIVRKVCRYIRQSKLEFTHIAVTGVSGITIGGPVALQLKKNLIVVRKGEVSHSNWNVEGIPVSNKPFAYIIIDDFVETGRTVYNIFNAIKQANNNSAPLSIIQYYGKKVNKCNIQPVVDTYEEYYLGIKK